jgi:hypothetical protein
MLTEESCRIVNNCINVGYSFLFLFLFYFIMKHYSNSSTYGVRSSPKSLEQHILIKCHVTRQKSVTKTLLQLLAFALPLFARNQNLLISNCISVQVQSVYGQYISANFDTKFVLFAHVRIQNFRVTKCNYAGNYSKDHFVQAMLYFILYP